METNESATVGAIAESEVKDMNNTCELIQSSLFLCMLLSINRITIMT